MRQKRSLIILGALLALFFIAFRIYVSLFTGAQITVNAPNGAEIYISTAQGGEQKKVGVSSATFRFREVPATLYVIVKNESSQAISGKDIVTNNQKVKFNLELSEQVESSVYFQGAVRDGLIKGTFVQGIEPKSDSIVSFDTERFVSPRIAFIGIPFLQDIEWVDQDNFVYLSYQNGAGAFIDGNKLPSNQFGANVIDINGKTISKAEGGEQTNFNTLVTGIASNNRTIYLSTQSAIYETRNLGRTVKKLFDVDTTTLRSYMHVDDSFLYRLEPSTPSETATETTGSLTEGEHDHQNTISIYKLNGQKQGQVQVNGNVLVGVVTTSTQSCMLTNQELVCVDGKNINKLPLYTRDISDIAMYNGNYYILAGSSVWMIANDTSHLQQVTEFKKHGVAVRDSLTVFSDGLRFGVLPTKEEGSNSVTLQIKP